MLILLGRLLFQLSATNYETVFSKIAESIHAIVNGKDTDDTTSNFTLVECLNLIMNFGAGSPVESVLLPYRCEDCQKEQLIQARTADLQASAGEVVPVKCPHCKSGNSVFDDFPEDYFQFLKFS